MLRMSARLRTYLFGVCSCHVMSSIRLRHMEAVEAPLLHRISCSVEEGAKDPSLVYPNRVFSVSMLFSHTLLAGLDMTATAFPMCMLISPSWDRLLMMIDPR